MKATLNLILLAMAVTAAAFGYAPPEAPEIDPGSGVAALSLLAGGVLVLRSRHNNKRGKK